MARIGFIGLGNMGGPMAINLLNAGHDLKVFDLLEDHMAPVVAEGARGVDCARDAVTEVDFVISMLPSGAIVESLYLYQDKLLEHIDTDTLVIECSTIAPENAINLANAANAKGIAAIDAPVSGGVGGAKAGTLTFIVGGDTRSFEKAEPVLGSMGKNVFHAGGHGSGQVAKICNNMLLAVHMIGTAEALQMGVDNGLDPKVLSDIMLQSSGRNWSLELYNPYPGVMDGVPAANHYNGGFQVDLMNKDLGLALEVALKSRSSTPMGHVAKSLYAMLSRKGNGGKDFSSIQKLFSQLEE
ncbi:MAG: 3-hydroxyisobutyrate dehydrogenase [Ketobacteraceae bacterium]|nr:3-hydroxyisobutyrate dehydrogenase [Ketobacteraceae bacterium]